jgi:hypothetical protein
MARLVPKKSDIMQKMVAGQPEPDPRKKMSKVIWCGLDVHGAC